MKPTDLARVYQARAQFLTVHHEYIEARATWARACVSDSREHQLQAPDLYGAATRIEARLFRASDELVAAHNDAREAGLIP